MENAMEYELETTIKISIMTNYDYCQYCFFSYHCYH